MDFSGNSETKADSNLTHPLTTFNNQKFLKILLDMFSITRKFLLYIKISTNVFL